MLGFGGEFGCFLLFMTQGLGVVLVMGEGCGGLGGWREVLPGRRSMVSVGGDGLVDLGRGERGDGAFCRGLLGVALMLV